MQRFFWSVFSRIWTEHGDLLRKSSYSVQIRESTDEEKNSVSEHFLRSELFDKKAQTKIN